MGQGKDICMCVSFLKFAENTDVRPPTVLFIIAIYVTKSLVNKNDHQFVVCVDVVCLT